MNNFKYNNDDTLNNNLNNKENKQIEGLGLESERLESEKKTSYSLKEEINRIIDFYKEQPSILVLVLLITYLLYYSLKNKSSLNIINNVHKLNMKGGSEESRSKLLNSIFELFVNTKLWYKLKQQYNYDFSILNKITVIFGYIFLGFIVRPIKSFFFILMVLIGIAGSFIFPFLIFGVMLYYVLKKVIFNKKPKFD